MSFNSLGADFQYATIQRAPHDQNNPYTMIHNDLLRDTSISPDCIWLIAYLLSHKDGWIIKPAQLISFMKGRWCKQKVYDILSEAIEAGYIEMQIYKFGNYTRYNYLLVEKPISVV